MATYERFPPLRRISRVQFANGTIIDGSQVDRSLGDLEERVNNLKPEDIRTAMTSNTIPFSFEPMASRQWRERVPALPRSLHPQHTYPWLPIRNTKETFRDPQPEPAGDYGPNSWRMMGSYPDRVLSAGEVEIPSNGTLRDPAWEAAWQAVSPAALPVPTSGSNWHWAYSHQWAFNEPAVLDHLTLFFRTEWRDFALWRDWPFDAYAPGTFVPYEGYGAPFTDGGSIVNGTAPFPQHGFVDDFILQFSVFDVHAPWKRMRDSVAWHVSKIEGRRFLFSEIPLGAPLADGVDYHDVEPKLPGRIASVAPLHKKGQQRGLLFRFPDLKIPIPASSQVRWMVAVPWYAPRESEPLSPAELRGWAQSESTPFADWAIHGSAVFHEGLLSNG